MEGSAVEVMVPSRAVSNPARLIEANRAQNLQSLLAGAICLGSVSEFSFSGVAVSKGESTVVALRPGALSSSTPLVEVSCMV